MYTIYDDSLVVILYCTIAINGPETMYPSPSSGKVHYITRFGVHLHRTRHRTQRGVLAGGRRLTALSAETRAKF